MSGKSPSAYLEHLNGYEFQSSVFFPKNKKKPMTLGEILTSATKVPLFGEKKIAFLKKLKKEGIF